MSESPNEHGLYGPNAGRRTSQPRSSVAQTPTQVPTESNAYLQTKVMTASPAELRLMLIEGAIRFSTQARVGLVSKNYEEAFTGFSKARAIVTELIAGLNPDVSPEICDRLVGLYTYVFTRLVDASSNQSVQIVDEVLGLLHFEKETWMILVENLVSENASAASLSEAPSVALPADAERSDTSSSVPTAGRVFTTG